MSRPSPLVPSGPKVADVTVRALEDVDAPLAAEVLTDAFLDFPALQVMVGRGPGARERMAAVFAMELEPESNLSGLVAELGGRIAGVLTYADSPACAAMSTGRVLRLARLVGPRAFGTMRMLGRIERAHPRSSHRHVPTIGVDPALQGRGIGGRLMEVFDQRCDVDEVDAYLETIRWSDPGRPSLEHFYGRLGFEILDVLPMTDAWAVVTMLRPAGA